MRFSSCLVGMALHRVNGVFYCLFYIILTNTVFRNLCPAKEPQFLLLTVLIVWFQDSASPLTQSSIFAKISLKLIDISNG